MINSRHVYCYWGGPLLFGPPMHIFEGVRTPPTPPGIDALGRQPFQDQSGEFNLRVHRAFPSFFQTAMLSLKRF